MKTWIAVPILAVASAALAVVLGASPWEATCAAAAGAAIVYALRALAGDGPAALVGAGMAALLAIAMVEHAPLQWLALACACWTFAELARPTQLGKTPAYVALAPAIAAAILEPGFVALVAIAGARLVPGPRRWLIAVPIVGACAIVVAVIAGTTDGALGTLWFGRVAIHHATPATAIGRLGDALGPLVIVAALGGLGTLARVHLASLAILACTVGMLLVDLRAGGPTPATLGLAAVCAGAGVGRLAGMIRIGSGQAIAAATCALMLLLPVVIQRG